MKELAHHLLHTICLGLVEKPVYFFISDIHYYNDFYFHYNRLSIIVFQACHTVPQLSWQILLSHVLVIKS